MAIVSWSVRIIYTNVLLKWNKTLQVGVTVLPFPSVFFSHLLLSQAQKELLDAELDFHKRLSSGEDTTELRKKLNQLQVEVSWSALLLLMNLWILGVSDPLIMGMAVFFPQAARLGILPVGRGKTAPAQGRGRGRGRGGRGRGMLNHMVVDHRPKALTVGGFVEEEKDELLQHFSVSVTCKSIYISFPAVKSSFS